MKPYILTARKDGQSPGKYAGSGLKKRKKETKPTGMDEAMFHFHLPGYSPEILTLLRKIMSALDDLKTEVEQVKTVEQSAVTLLQGLKAQLDAAIASGDPAALEALSADLKNSADALAAAVVANTPIPAPEPPPSPSSIAA